MNNTEIPATIIQKPENNNIFPILVEKVPIPIPIPVPTHNSPIDYEAISDEEMVIFEDLVDGFLPPGFDQ